MTLHIAQISYSEDRSILGAQPIVIAEYKRPYFMIAKLQDREFYAHEIVVLRSSAY
jgi:hypothetical protein